MFYCRIISYIISALLLISLIPVSAPAAPAQHSCMVLVTATSGGSVQPDGAISVLNGSGITLTFTPSSGYTLQKILVDGSDAGQYSTISLSPVVHDMTVHAIFAPEGRHHADTSPGDESSPVISGSPDSSPETKPMEGDCSGAGNTSEKALTVGPVGADYPRIQDAITNASPGDTIYIKTGTYAEKITIQKPLSLVGLQGDSERPVISSGVNGSIITITTDNVLIRNLSVSGARGNQGNNAAIVGSGLSDLTVENCVIRDSVHGIDLNRTERVTIRDNTIRNISQTGVLLTSSNQSLLTGNSIEQCQTGVWGNHLTGLIFRDNLVISNIQYGAVFRRGITDADISGNLFSGKDPAENFTVVNDNKSSLYLESANNVTISRNKITRSPGIALILDEAVRMTITNNTLYDNAAGFSYTGTIVNPGNQIDTSNTIDGLPLQYYEGKSGDTIDGISPSTLYLLNCTNVTARGLIMNSRNGFGIQVRGGSNITITNCSVSGNVLENIRIAEVNRGYVTGNKVSGKDGIHLTGTHDLQVENNHVEALNTGIKISSLHPENSPDLNRPCFGNIFTRNNVSAGKSPIYLTDTNEWIYGNSFTLNDFVTIPGSSDINQDNPNTSDSSSGDGVSMNFSPLFHSISNQTPGKGGVGNFWETGERERYRYNNTTFSGYLGNHWSNYSGSEVGTSGVGVLPVQINAENTDNYPLLKTQEGYTVEGSGYHLELQPGWNFVSIPTVLSSGSDTARIFSMVGTAGHSMYTFNDSTWNPLKGGDPILPLHGYWLYSEGLSSVPLSFDPGTIPSPVHLLSGWNAIGYPGIQEAVARDAFGSLDASWSYIIGFNASSQTYDNPILEKSVGDEILYPSQGYWIYMNQEWDLQPVTG